MEEDNVYIGEVPAGSAPATGKTGGITYNADGSIHVPTNGSKYIPQADDRVRCDDGYIYEIKAVKRYDNNVFVDDPGRTSPHPNL